MPINPSIALSVKPVEFQDPTVAYGRIAAIQQAQQQNALAQMQMAEYARARQEEEGVRNYLAGKDISAPDTQAGLYQYGKTGIDYATKLQAAQKARMEQQSAELKLAGDRAEQAGRIYGTVTDQASWDRAKPKLAALGGDPTRLPEQFDPAFINSEIQSALSVKDRLEQHFVNQDVGASTRVLTMPKYGGGPAAVVSGSDVAKTLPPQALTTLAKLQAERDALPEGDPRRAAYDDMIAKETKVPFQRVATDMGSNILGGRFNPATGLTEYTETVAKGLTPDQAKNASIQERRLALDAEKQKRDADPEFQQRLATAKATGEAIAKGDVAAQQALPKIVTRAEEGLRLIDELVGKRDPQTGALLAKDPKTGEKLTNNRPHPGFENAVGATWLPGARFVPGTDAAGFMARFDQIKGASFLEAFEALKGGGSITEKEGAKGTDAINRMSTSTNEREFIRAAMDLKNIIQNGIRNAQARASRGVATPAASGAPAAPTSGATVSNW